MKAPDAPASRNWHDRQKQYAALERPETGSTQKHGNHNHYQELR